MSRRHPRLIAPTRELLIESGLPYVIENVVPENEEKDEDPLIDPIELCGAMFGLGTYRHRLFESNMPITAPDHPAHTARTTKMGRPPVDGEFMHVVGNFSGVAQAKKAMGISWMTRDGLRESIPPHVHASHRPSVDGSACGGGGVTAPDPGLSDLIAAHLVETVTPDGDCGVFILDCTCGAEVRFTQADLNAAPVDSTAGALHYMLREHVAVVLEQHTNGRIAELRGWQIKVATALGMCEEVMGIGYSIANAKDSSERAESLTTVELEHIECPVWCDECERMERWQSCTYCNGSGCGPGTASGAYEECEWCAGDSRDHEPDLTDRADKAEATIARVEAEAALLERMIRTAPWSRYTEVRRSHLRSLRAALEGPGDAG